MNEALISPASPKSAEASWPRTIKTLEPPRPDGEEVNLEKVAAEVVANIDAVLATELKVEVEADVSDAESTTSSWVAASEL
jgi:hypothetical protein